MMAIMVVKKAWNTTLVLLLGFITLYSISKVTGFATQSYNVYFWSLAFATFGQLMCHWIITKTYLKTSHDVEAILDVKVHMKKKERLAEVTTFNKRL